MSDKTIKQMFGEKSAILTTYAKCMYDFAMQGKWGQAYIDYLLAMRTCATRHTYIMWCGDSKTCCQPDKWILIKNGREYSLDIDSIRANNTEAMCVDVGSSRWFEPKAKRYSIQCDVDRNATMEDCHRADREIKSGFFENPADKFIDFHGLRILDIDRAFFFITAHFSVKGEVSVYEEDENEQYTKLWFSIGQKKEG